METIGKGKYVIVILSNEYLMSENCMFEMLEIKNHGSINQRVFPIVLNDAAIYVPSERLKYNNHWINEKA
ncbi:MAG: hypothetical protein JWQ38_2147, partial [Flavipsychrobacter sp.]|nr:hypothetical protein [Flavipsychrobacter sp.]